MPAKQMLVDVTEPLENAGRAVPGAVNVHIDDVPRRSGNLRRVPLGIGHEPGSP